MDSYNFNIFFHIKILYLKMKIWLILLYHYPYPYPKLGTPLWIYIGVIVLHQASYFNLHALTYESNGWKSLKKGFSLFRKSFFIFQFRTRLIHCRSNTLWAKRLNLVTNVFKFFDYSKWRAYSFSSLFILDVTT